MTSEHDLIEGCKKGKESAFEALYTRYARRMMSIAKRYSNTTFEAEDLVQETFIKVFEKIQSYDHKGSFEGWIKRVLINMALNNKKYMVESRPEEYAYQVVDESTEGAISKLSNDELLQLLNKLPFGFRTVFNLFVIEGYNHKEIGEICGIEEATSRSQLARAKIMLKELFIKNYCLTDERK